MQQRDIGRFVIKCQQTANIQVNIVGRQSVVNTHFPFTVLTESTMFAKLMQCFDQFKVNAIKVRLVPTAVTSPDGTYIQSCAAWDRNSAADNITFEMVSSYGSAKTNYFMGGAKTAISHFISAETIGEKTQYMQTAAFNAGPLMWNPKFFFGIKSPVAVQENQNYQIIYVVEWSFDVTFRGTRYQ